MKDLIFKAEEISVKLSYLKGASEVIDLLSDNLKYCVIADAKVLEMHQDFKNRLLEKGCLIFEVEEAEKQKNLETYSEAIAFMQKNGMNRHDCLIGFGGGAITDLTGFVASSYMRGIKYFQIPTSLLAQVDASIGGKTGINFGHIKNFVGSFYNPAEVFICADFLETLNEQEFLNGFSEVIKHSFITSKESVEEINKTSQEILAKDADIMLRCIEESIQIKAQIVASDFREKGARRYLNFGHTFAHGIESVNHKDPIFHGHAVIIGMLMALKYSKELGFLQEDSYKLAKDTIGHFNYDFSNIELDAEEIFEAMKSDKKNTKAINLVLLREIGQPFIYEEKSSEKLKTFIKEFINDFTK